MPFALVVRPREAQAEKKNRTMRITEHSDHISKSLHHPWTQHMIDVQQKF